MKVEERFLNYVKIDTQSDEHSDSVPTTAKQLDQGAGEGAEGDRRGGRACG